MSATFNCNFRRTVFCCYSSTNYRDELGIATFYDRLSTLAWPILKHNVQILGEDTNAQTGNDENQQFCLHNLPNRNEQYQADFSLVNKLLWLNNEF